MANPIQPCKSAECPTGSGTTSPGLRKLRSAVLGAARDAFRAEGRDFDREALNSPPYRETQSHLRRQLAKMERLSTKFELLLAELGVDHVAFRQGTFLWLDGKPAPRRTPSKSGVIDRVHAFLRRGAVAQRQVELMIHALEAAAAVAEAARKAPRKPKASG